MESRCNLSSKRECEQTIYLLHDSIDRVRLYTYFLRSDWWSQFNPTLSLVPGAAFAGKPPDVCDAHRQSILTTTQFQSVLMTLVGTVGFEPTISAPQMRRLTRLAYAPFLASVGFCERMTVRTQKPQVFNSVVIIYAVNVIQVQSYFLTTPCCYVTLAALVWQQVFF